MKLYVLTDNTPCSSNFAAEHGLSLYLESGTQRVLFDMGETSLFAENAKKLQADLDAVDFAVVSHGHSDHGGGLPHFLQQNSHAPVYLAEQAFVPCFNAEKEYIGLDAALRTEKRLYFVRDICMPAKGFELRTCNEKERPHGSAAYGLQIKQDGKLLPDTFLHEQYLLIEENGKRILISGCSHKGILNIMEWYHPDVLIGGFHFMKLDPAADAVLLRGYAEALLKYNCEYYTCHCTGLAQYQLLKTVIGDALHALTAGDVLTV
ncbi:MAG: MBL fold metallo-hydrolase [Oscillospiraceae bacterium]|nr:MBL fold metallo-hydrolase [Oscillospiraceae bacterium]